jgi:hypothetical protein
VKPPALLGQGGLKYNDKCPYKRHIEERHIKKWGSYENRGTEWHDTAGAMEWRQLPKPEKGKGEKLP